MYNIGDKVKINSVVAGVTLEATIKDTEEYEKKYYYTLTACENIVGDISAITEDSGDVVVCEFEIVAKIS